MVVVVVVGAVSAGRVRCGVVPLCPHPPTVTTTGDPCHRPAPQPQLTHVTRPIMVCPMSVSCVCVLRALRRLWQGRRTSR